MDKSRIQYLLHQYANDLASKEEVEELFALLGEAENKDVLTDALMNDIAGNVTEAELAQPRWGKMWTAIQSAKKNKQQHQMISMRWLRMAAAAMIIFGVAGGIYFSAGKRSASSMAEATSYYRNDVQPGGNKATLTLADGSIIPLDGEQNDTVALQGNTVIIKGTDGQLVYHAKTSTNEILYNTVTTPEGGKYQLVLPDGSQVWLNAASALRFPAAFTGNERDVELTGEAYFEVAKNASMPFHVKATGTDVKVLGTHFNVMAYPDEQTTKTTLLEGKVTVTHGVATEYLEPGMQAIVDKQTQHIKIIRANTEESVGWKNDVFRFKDTNIKELMRQVQRWYNVEVEYRTNGNDQNFTGIVPRLQNVSALLQTLELTGTVHFSIEQSSTPGKAGKIIVLP